MDDYECEFDNLYSSLIGITLEPGVYYVVVDGYNGLTGDFGLNIEYSAPSQGNEGYFTFESHIDRETEKMESSGFSESEIDFIINQSFQRSIAINNSRDHGIDCGTFNIYQIYNSLDNTLIHETTELSFTHEGLSNGTEYCYYISVQYEEGESDPSDAVCATPNELSEINYSLGFDGVDDKVDIHNSQGGPLVGTDDFSVAFWFKTNNLVNSTTYKMLASSDDYDEQWAFAIEYGGLENQAIGTLSFIVNTGGQNSTLNYDIRSEERIDDGNWHFAVGTREKSTGLVKLYRWYFI